MTVAPIELTLIQNGVERKVWTDANETLAAFALREVPATQEKYSTVYLRDYSQVILWPMTLPIHRLLAGDSQRKLFVDVHVDWHRRAVEAEAERDDLRLQLQTYGQHKAGCRGIYEPQHVCGLQGYNPMIDPPCPACKDGQTRVGCSCGFEAVLKGSDHP